jgi:site-specific recombinase XerD
VRCHCQPVCWLIQNRPDRLPFKSALTLEELQRRNYSHRTAKTYIRIVREFATYFHRPPDKLGPEQIRQYQAHLFQNKKLSPSSVSQYVSAIR